MRKGRSRFLRSLIEENFDVVLNEKFRKKRTDLANNGARKRIRLTQDSGVTRLSRINIL